MDAKTVGFIPTSFTRMRLDNKLGRPAASVPDEPQVEMMPAESPLAQS